MKQRIWELDAFRGICIIGVVIVHYVFDLIDLYGLVSWDYPPSILFLMDWGGILFVVLSGICVTLGKNHIQRGLQVLFCGLIITAVTYGMYRMDLARKDILIYFGILHCLGICMILWHFLQHLPNWVLWLSSLPLVVLGFYLDTISPVNHLWLLPLGILPPTFSTADYFPLLPYLGFFLLGAFIGRTFYRNQQTLLPKIDPQHPIVHFFRFCGRHSLAIYLLHQPVLFGILLLMGKL